MARLGWLLVAVATLYVTAVAGANGDAGTLVAANRVLAEVEPNMASFSFEVR